MSVTFVLDLDSFLEIVEAEAPDLSEAERTLAAQDMLDAAASGICLNSLAAHVAEQTGIDPSDYEGKTEESL